MRWHPLNGYSMSLPAALPWRADVPEVARTGGHDHGRVTSSGWVYCRSHRTWEPLERRVWPDTARMVVSADLLSYGPTSGPNPYAVCCDCLTLRSARRAAARMIRRLNRNAAWRQQSERIGE